MQRSAPRPGPGMVKPMAGVIFSAIDPTDADVSRQRADSPDSGQGGYFTQSETESGASGSQSPVETSHHIYKIARDTRHQPDNRKTKSQLLGSHPDVRSQDRGGVRSTGRPLTTNTQNNNKVSNNKAKLPPRPPRPSGSLPPPVPKKLRDTRRGPVSSVSVSRRTVPPPERRQTSGRTLPLQIQSPSIVQALRAANTIRENRSSSLGARQNVGNNPGLVPRRTPNVSPSKSVRNVEKSGLSGHEKTADKSSSRLVQNHREEDHRSKNPIKPSKTSKSTSNGSVSTRVLKDQSSDTIKSKPAKIASESLASRAKRQTEDKMKLLYSSLRSPKQERKMNFSDRRKKLQREEILVTSSNSGESEFPKQPVQSLIKMYDKSKVKSVQLNKQKELKSSNYNLSSKPNIPAKTIAATKSNPNVNVVKSNKAVAGETRQTLKNKSGSGLGSGASSDPSRHHLTNLNKETKPSSAKTNSIDEFLLSAKRTRQKYQNMLAGEEPAGKQNDNLGVKADPTESDLQTGCFTDVSYAGYFARQPSEHHQRLNDISICGNTSDLEEDQNKLCKQRGSVDQEAITDAGEAHLAGAGAEITQKSASSENKAMPTPSPRLKKKQRREQFLQEHKQFGKNMLAIAKTNLEQDPGEDHVVDKSKDHIKDGDKISLRVTTEKCQSSLLRNEMEVAHDEENLLTGMRNGAAMNSELKKLEQDIESLTMKCKILEKEKQDAVNNLMSTQLMSTDQIDKLETLERKQDFLEAENRATREKLMFSENEFNKLTNQYYELEQSKEQLERENTQLNANIKQKSAFLSKLETEKDFQAKQNDMETLDKKIEDLQDKIKTLNVEKKDLEGKINLQMSDHYADIKKIRDAYQAEKEGLDSQLTTLKENLHTINEENEKLHVEKKQLDEKLSKINQLDYEDVIDQLKLELKQSKALVREAQSGRAVTESTDKLIKQLKSQLEEAELEKTASLRRKKTMEMDILDLEERIHDLDRDKRLIESKYEDAVRENGLLNSQLRDNEDELENILTKYKSSIATLTEHQTSLQNQAVIIAELENENINLVEKMESLQKKLGQNEEMSDHNNSNTKSELKIRELEHKIDLELAAKRRIESQIEKMNERLAESEQEQASAQKSVHIQEEVNRKLNTQMKDLKEDVVTLQIREMDIVEKKNILEKKLEIAEAETITVRSHLELANRRIEDLQMALNCDTESECSSIPYSDSYQDDLDVFLMNHRRRMAEQKEEERKIRESLLKESKAESEC